MKFSFSIKPYQYVDFQFQSKGISNYFIYYYFFDGFSVVIKFLVIQDLHK